MTTNRYTDIELIKTESGYYDFSFDEYGDFKKVKGFDTAILITILGEKRADESEMPVPQLRRGWWGNEILGFGEFEQGSKLWELYQARADQTSLNLSETFMREAFQWFLDDKHLDSVKVDSSYDDYKKLIIHIDLMRDNDLIDSKNYSLWENTFV